MRGRSIYGILCACLWLACRCVASEPNDIAAEGVAAVGSAGAQSVATGQLVPPLASPDGSFQRTLMDNVTKKTPVDRLDEMSKDVAKEMANNPYFKIPTLDRKLRELAVLHPDVMERLGVYVIPVKSASTTAPQSTPSTSEPAPEEKEEPAVQSAASMQTFLSHIIKQSEMIKVMTPEEKLQYIPRLKETIVYEILKNSQTIDSLSAQIAHKEMYGGL